MTYQLRAAESVGRDVRRLSKSYRQRVSGRLQALCQDPRPHGCVKLRALANAYHIRVSSYRVIYDVDDATQTITILRVKHRRETYRSM